MTKGTDMQPDRLSPEAEREVDRVLAFASRPALPEDAFARLMARAAAEPQDAKITVLAGAARRQPPPRPGLWRYAAALPLAASLALGVYLGARGTLDFMLPSAITGGVAMTEDVMPDDLGGVGEADAYAQETRS